ncbi:MAG: phage tail tape measure protein [Devosia sp.]|nr:phage tail tape measure protein [Devosia sp.]
MAGKTLTSSLIVRLIDQVSAPARKVGAALLGIENNSRGGFAVGISNAMERNEQALNSARMKMLDVVGTLYILRGALTAPIQAAANFETQLEDIGQKAGIPQEKLGALGEQIKQVARDTNQATSDMAKAIDFLVGMGSRQETALAVAEPIGKAATAYRAATEDLARATFAVVDNLKVPAADAERALDAMAKAGKEGGFELKDMAKEFPALTASAQFLGMEGVVAVSDLAAALEVARKGAADGAQAANNMANFMQKLTTKETIKNFDKFGVNVSRELKYAVDNGISPIEHMLMVLNKVSEGGDAELVASIFGDKQVLEFIRPMLANMDEYSRIREEAMGAQGTVEEDYARRLQTSQAMADRWKATIENLNTSIGQTLLPLITDLSGKMIPIVDSIGSWADKNPQLTSTLIAATVALVGFKAATTALSFIGLMGKGGALAMLAVGFRSVARYGTAAKSAIAMQTSLAALSGANYSGFNKLVDGIKAMALAAPGMSGIGGALTAVGAAVAGISAPALAAIGAAVAAVAVAGFFIWKYWDRVSSVFWGVAKRLGEELSPALEAAKPLLEWFSGIGKVISDAWNATAKAVGGFFGSLFGQEKLTDEQKAGYEDMGYQLVDGILAGMKRMWDNIAAWFAQWPQMILDAIGSIDIGSLFKFPDVGAMFGGGGEPEKKNWGKLTGPAFDGASGRARGGNMWAGSTYRINEEGEEFFSPKSSVFAHKAGEAPGAMASGGGVHIGQLIIEEASNAAETARQVKAELRGLLRGAHSDSMARV